MQREYPIKSLNAPSTLHNSKQNSNKDDFKSGISSKSTDKKDPQKKGKFSITSAVKNWATNINFKLDSIANSVELDEAPLIYLGKKYDRNMQKILDKQISQTIWFSYREKMPPIMNETFKKSLTCDRGWGCMIRCGQMLLAEGIKRHFQGKGLLVNGFKQDDLLAIISLFADFVKDGIIAPFSIHQICSTAYEHFKAKPGEWYRSSTVMISLDMLNEKYGKRRIPNLRLCVFNDGTIYEDQIFEKAFNIPKEDQNSNSNQRKKSGTEDETDKEETKVNGNGIKDSIENKGLFDKMEWDNSMLVFLSTKTGLSNHNVLYLPTIAKLLRFPQSLGILGGKDNKGYYFLGFQNATLLYLDPHYVQEASGNYEEMEKKYQTFFRKKIFQIPVSEVDTSIGFGFYIKDQKDYQDFKQRITTAIKGDRNFLVGFEEVTPSIEYNQGDIIEISGFDEENFDIIQ